MDDSRLDAKRVGVAASATIGSAVNGLVYGVLISIALVPISREFSWPRAYVSGVSMITGPMLLVWHIVIGWLGDRFGVRWLLLGGNLLFAFSLFLASFTPPVLLDFYILFVLASLAGAINGPQLFMKMIAGWFDRRRGTVMGIVAGAGIGAGNVVFPIIVAVLLSHFGWRGAFRGAAVVVALVGFPAMFLFLRDPPRASPTRAAAARSAADVDFWDALRSRTYWLLVLATALGSACMMTIASHIVPALTDRHIGLAPAVAVLTALTATGGITQILIGWLLDRLSVPWVAAPLYATSVLGIFLVLHAQTEPLLLAGGMCVGIGVGTEFAILPLLVSRYFGVRHYGAIVGVTYACIGLATSVAPFLVDSLFDARGSYVSGFQYIQIALLVGAALIAILPRFATERVASEDPVAPAMLPGTAAAE